MIKVRSKFGRISGLKSCHLNRFVCRHSESNMSQSASTKNGVGAPLSVLHDIDAGIGGCASCQKPIYLDWNATTPIFPEVRKRMCYDIPQVHCSNSRRQTVVLPTCCVPWCTYWSLCGSHHYRSQPRWYLVRADLNTLCFLALLFVGVNSTVNCLFLDRTAILSTIAHVPYWYCCIFCKMQHDCFCHRYLKMFRQSILRLVLLQTLQIGSRTSS